MNSFNVYGQTTETIGGSTPVWLGTVKPIPVGASVQVYGGDHFPAGTLVTYDAIAKTISWTDGIDVVNTNAYLYNDIYVSEDVEVATATCAIVMHHPEGLLIERVYPEITEEQIVALQKNIPGVLLVRG